MVTDRKNIDFRGKTIIEKLIIEPPLKQSPVFQNEACFLYFREGASVISSPNEQVSVHQNESILLKCGSYFADIFHKNASGVCEVYVIHLFPEILQNIFKDEVPFFVKQQYVSKYTNRISQKNVIDHFIQSLHFYFENQEMINQEIIYLKIKELILLLVQSNVAETVIELYNHLFNPHKSSIVEVLEAHLFSNLTVEQLATLCGLSLSTFKREFKKHFNDSPASYIRERRLKKAAELLKHSAYSVSEICYQVGYEDGSYFSRMFHQKFQLSPTDFRNNSLK